MWVCEGGALGGGDQLGAVRVYKSITLRAGQGS